MEPSLIGCRLKLSKADENLAFLDAEVRTFFEGKDRRLGGYFDADASEYIIAVRGDPPPLEWGIAVSEFAHHTRSALDNLLWQLVLLRGGTPSRRTQFPIYDDRARYAKEAPRMLTGVSASDAAFIEGAQPYHLGGKRTTRHPLALLGYLNNIDKHRFLHAACVATVVWDQGGLTGIPPMPYYADALAILMESKYFTGAYIPIMVDLNKDAGENAVNVRFCNRPDDGRTEIMRVAIKPVGPHPKVNMQDALPISVTLSDRERPMLIEDFKRIRATVQEIVDRFAPEFA